ncbi:hypothetical protein KQX54_008881 [Cotesia glomerata]|uniref:Uncharacterized protein n=1 Tax=Cotesia glomerata TaxID=32391 RepID=A0AAV7J464_COTGL|nr:hypothetical protein KQX54_008881 [Cotesia glomerata]
MVRNTISITSHLNFYDLLFITDQKLALCLESLDDSLEGILQSGFQEKFPLLRVYPRVEIIPIDSLKNSHGSHSGEPNP